MGKSEPDGGVHCTVTVGSQMSMAVAGGKFTVAPANEVHSATMLELQVMEGAVVSVVVT